MAKRTIYRLTNRWTGGIIGKLHSHLAYLNNNLIAKLIDMLVSALAWYGPGYDETVLCQLKNKQNIDHSNKSLN